MSQPPDWESKSSSDLMMTAAAHSYGATRTLKRIENLLWWIAAVVTIMFVRLFGLW